MSLSTTSTAVYILAKYSRASPSSSGAKESNEEWQHFTNPTIRLILDMRKSATRDLESYRCRVLWSFSAGVEGVDADQNEVTFEDLELLSFSSPSVTQNNKQMFAIHGLPLKAVYRDAIVGIRYLHPRTIPVGATPVNFQSESDASNFVDAIRPVCPCKVNPPTAAPSGPTRAMTMVTSKTSSSKAMPPPDRPAVNQALRPAATMQSTRPQQLIERDIVMLDETQQSMSSSDAMLTISGTAITREMSTGGTISRSATHVPTASSSIARSSQTTGSSQSLVERGPYSVSAASVDKSALLTRSQGTSQQIQLPQLATAQPLASSVPASLPAINPAPSATSSLTTLATSMPAASSVLSPPTLSTDTTSGQTSDTNASLLTSLRELPTLYNLPRAELESLVAHIIREDGFTNLLRTLDSMWKINVLLGPISSMQVDRPAVNDVSRKN